MPFLSKKLTTGQWIAVIVPLAAALISAGALLIKQSGTQISQSNVLSENRGIITSGQTGGTNTVINHGPSQRKLRDDQIRDIQNSIRSRCETMPVINVTAATSNLEAQVYGADFVKAFRLAGCKSDLALPTPGLRPEIGGIIIGVRPAIQNVSQLHDAPKAAAGALNAAHIEFSFSPMEDSFFPSEEFVLVIGRQ